MIDDIKKLEIQIEEVESEIKQIRTKTITEKKEEKEGEVNLKENQQIKIKGKRRITADTALRLSKYFGNSAKFWLGLQDDYDLEEESKLIKKELEEIHTVIV